MLRTTDKFNSYLAWEIEKSNTKFYCPNCNSEVILRKGKIRTHHFAHKPPINCIYGSGESEIHYRIKKELYEYLSKQSNCKKCEIERNLETVRPDISLYINDTPIAIEIQKSSLDISIIQKRMQEYYKKKISVLWILPDKEPNLILHKNENQQVHKLKEWERYLHAMFYGRVYYWQRNNILKAYKFEDFHIEKPLSEFYSEDEGEVVVEGGYKYKAKLLKIPYSNNRILNPDIPLELKFSNGIH
jgi:competence protein CoiA